jgi:hypothetical protein
MVCIMVDAQNDTAIIVPIVTQHQLSDTSCVLNVGDHPFIKRPSCASYDFAQIISLSETNRQIEEKKIRLRRRVSDELLIRLLVGFVSSDETVPRVFQAAHGQALIAGLKHRGHIR